MNVLVHGCAIVGSASQRREKMVFVQWVSISHYLRFSRDFPHIKSRLCIIMQKFCIEIAENLH